MQDERTHNGAAQRDLVIICAYPREAAAVAARMQQAQRTHFGLFRGYLGQIAGIQTALAITGPGEFPSYNGLRQLRFLFQPKWALNFGVAGAVAEGLHIGDLVLVRESIRIYCPAAIPDNLFGNDQMLFPSEELRARILDAPAMLSSRPLLKAAQDALNHDMPKQSLQVQVPDVCAGCTDQPLFGWRSRGFTRLRYQTETVDMESYGFLSAAVDAELSSLSLKVLSDDCAEDARKTFETNAKRLLAIGAEGLETVAESLKEGF